ncbi:hypothetical protein LUZ63_019896 [Rhynchospora breviuscula]|uniref:Non-specific lipid-transfer protein n=1 Tax=Rhynchospora breviuscula TaxID=2022672 RepID=A0A9Q0C723_9POAL|nr:hypothetical protein LUZ63_019896 [Rhynchospora breviuscula]
MANCFVATVAVAALVLLLTAPRSAESAITCGQAATSIAPCLGFAKTGKGSPPASCCTGVKSLNTMAKSTVDRQAVCNCLKKAAGSITGLNPGAAASIPGKCGVNIPYSISTSIDCSKVH